MPSWRVIRPAVVRSFEQLWVRSAAALPRGAIEPDCQVGCALRRSTKIAKGVVLQRL